VAASKSVLAGVLVKAIYIVYDGLNDDDEEIRDTVAKVASRLLTAVGTTRMSFTLKPEAASIRLVEDMANVLASSAELCIEALHRLTSSGLSHGAMDLTVSSMLRTANADDNVLFVQEKQNLYVDEVRDATRWARLLQRLRNEAITSRQATALTRWALGGIKSLTDTAEAQNRGQMSWSSGSDNFILGMRVICAAEVSLDWSSRSSQDIRNGSRILEALGNLAKIGRNFQLHDLWLQKVEAILRRSIWLRLLSVTRKLGSVAIIAR